MPPPASHSYADLRQRHHALEGTIARHKAQIVDCERELAECLEMLQQFPRADPVLTLPMEIMSEIFSHCLPLPYSESLTPSPDEIPMLLLHVCRAWRVIAIATPKLWVDLHLDLSRLPPSFFDSANFDEFLAACRVRAGSCPISLDLRGSVPSEEDGRRLITSTFDQLASRIEVLELTTDIDYFREHRPRFPLLRKLTFTVKDEDIGVLKDNPIQTFSAASQLRELFLSYAAPSMLTIPWEKLTEFSGFALSTKECVDVLRLAPSLVKWSVEGAHRDSRRAAIRKITHPNVKSFHFHADEHTFFQSLTFPALEDLSVAWADMGSSHLLQFLTRSSSTLLKLTARQVPLVSLSSMVALTELNLRMLSNKYMDEFFCLINRTKNPKFLPQLQVLTTTDCPPFVNMILISALSSRCAAPRDGAAKLRRFRQFWTYITYDELKVDYNERVGLCLAELAKDGLDIYVGPWKPGRY